MKEYSDDLWKELARAEERAEQLTAAKSNKERNAAQIDHWTQAVLLERAAYLRKLAQAGEGDASETIRAFPRHGAMLSVRLRSGQAEIHDRHADLFVVLSGQARIVTGGQLAKPKTVAEGETRGEAIEGGQTQELRQGDIVHVPAGAPHQFLVSHERPVACLVIKIEETE